eukprot:5873622-Karenia_brevis.AAC.1
MMHVALGDMSSVDLPGFTICQPSAHRAASVPALCDLPSGATERPAMIGEKTPTAAHAAETATASAHKPEAPKSSEEMRGMILNALGDKNEGAPETPILNVKKRPAAAAMT